MSSYNAKDNLPETLDSRDARILKRGLAILVLVMTFEGLARKLDIPGTSVPIFLLKDIVVLFLGMIVLRMSRPPAIDFLWGAYMTVCVFFLPVFFATMLHDPILAIFGAKEYLLYPFVGFAFFFAYHDSSLDEIYRFFRWTALLIIPTTIIALIQLRLPATHWLNLAVDGETLAGFSAGGQLRVSSTFSFVAQYAAFLNAEIFVIVIALNRMSDMKTLSKLIYLALVPLLLISCYITGSRGAVLGAGSIVLFALAFSLLKFQVNNAIRVAVIIVGLFIIVTILQHFLPDEFAAYSAREEGQLVGVSGEIQQRVIAGLFDWTNNVFSVPPLGNGVGIMSNGSNYISDYADSFRSLGKWTETDFASTLFEGGIYFVVVWYGFRYYVIFQTAKRTFLETSDELSVPAAFSQALVVIVGLFGTLGIQPPVAIWWWLAIGTSMVLWWKSVEPAKKAIDSALAPPKPGEKKIRGRSAYAERLHAGK